MRGFLVLCLQLTFNFTILILPMTPVAGGVTTYWVFAVVYFIAALLLFVAFGPKPLFGVGTHNGSSALEPQRAYESR